MARTSSKLRVERLTGHSKYGDVRASGGEPGQASATPFKHCCIDVTGPGGFPSISLRGGTNAGPTPTETIAAALIACTNVIGNKCAKKHGVEIESLSIDAESTFDRRGTQLLEEIEIPFQKIVLRISLVTEASEEQIERVRADLHRFCPVSKLIRNAGTTIEEEWIVTRPGA